MIGLFAAFLLAPLVSLAFGGFDELAERRLSTQDFEPVAFAGHSDEYRSTLLREAITGSVMGAATIKWRSEVDEELLGVGGRAGVLEGREGWLFSRDQFDGGLCRNESQAALAMRTLAAMAEIAKGAELEFIFSVSPDKVLVHPEKLTWRQAAYAECKQQNARQWREIAARLGVPMLDHLDALRGPPSPPRFFATDTHWNAYGATIAFEGLRAHFLGAREWSPKLALGDTAVRDLMRNLRLDDEEPDLVPTNAPPIGEQVSGRTVIVHDSFYREFHERMLELFASPHGHDMNIEGTDADALAGALTPDTSRLVVNSVERLLFSRFEREDRPFTWTGMLGRALLAYNVAAARDCAFEQGDSVAVGAGRTAALQLLEAPNGVRPCIQVESEGAVRIELPVPDDGTVAADWDYPVELAEPTGGVALVFPEHLSGREVRVTSTTGAATTASIGLLEGD